MNPLLYEIMVTDLKTIKEELAEIKSILVELRGIKTKASSTKKVNEEWQMTFDTYPFTDAFDPAVSPTTQFCKRYRASIVQTRMEEAEMEKFPPVFQSLAETSSMYMRRHPVVDVKMSIPNLEVLLKDFEDLTKLQQFIRLTPGMIEEYQKFLTWAAISR